MNRSEFLNMLIKKCDIDSENGLDESTQLDSLEDWDSLALITMMSVFKTYLNFIPDLEKMKNCNYVKDILDLGEGRYTE